MDTVWGRDAATGVFMENPPGWFKSCMVKDFKALCGVERFRLSDHELEALASRCAPLCARAHMLYAVYAGQGDESKPH